MLFVAYFCVYEFRVGERPPNSLNKFLLDIKQRNVIYNSIFISFKTVCRRIKSYKKGAMYPILIYTIFTYEIQ